ncbi:MAG: CoA transferase [Gammaproteobacteria bacterium]|nr:CoA transferase [Gammaproteobacteria bacterium]
MQAFSNIRVIDLTHVIAGPFCTYQLAVMGADVIKIEPPHNPDMTRANGHDIPHGENGLGFSFTSQNANKRAIGLDIKSPKGKEVLTKLIETADVLVENYRSGALAKLGLGYEDVKKIRPDIIYCSMTGFGQGGPKAQHTAYDNVIQAFSGLMEATGSSQTAPMKVGPPVLDYGTGIQAAFAIAAALFQRTQTGEGQHIDVAMLDSAIMLMSANVTYYDQMGKLLGNSGNMSATNAGYSCYQTMDGLLMMGAFTGEQLKNMWCVLGDKEHGDELRSLQPPAMGKHVEKDTKRLAKLFMEKTAAEWEVIMNENKVPAARVRKLDETLKHAQLQSRTLLQVPEDSSNDQKLPTASFKYAENGPALHRAPPMFAQHTRQILTEIGYSQSQISELNREEIIATLD